ncbi:hypothetical protein [Pseudomonas sp. GV071]|jgi:hypothetical protein|uniref:hypothetical protein n=1 Tax=Pseudomonas sp. GV071 TaxID=2135754 RepID=UPI000D3886D4|nr:hypothetical protein [Pseudomonas sp. GV071]PTQ68232.1 hypothetical protein C8K61_112149 [Pseudomonas sp. GV071]
MAAPVIHYKTAGHLACGRETGHLAATTELAKVKCRTCRNSEAFKDARKDARNSARRAARKAKATHSSLDWRAAWREQLSALPGHNRLPRGFGSQPFV